jgi:hypothetical protein
MFFIMTNKKNKPLLTLLLSSCLIFVLLFLIFYIKAGFNRCPKTGAALDKKTLVQQTAQKRQQRYFSDWRDEAAWKVRRAGMGQAVRIVSILTENRIYEPGAAAEVIVGTLGIRNPDMQLIMSTARKRISSENLRKSLEIARENQAALYFTLPIIKGAIIEEIEKSRVK